MHFVGGLVGSLLIGFFANPEFFGGEFKEGLFYGGGAELLGEQALANGVTIVYSFVVTFVDHDGARRRTIGIRVSDEDEDTGLDLAEHAETAYHTARSAIARPDPEPSDARKERPMKLITAVIKPFKLDDVKAALKAAGVDGMTVTEVQGLRPPGRPHRGLPRRRVHRSTSCRRSKLEIVVDDDERRRRRRRASPRAAATGKIGDGKIWVTDVERRRAHPHRRARAGRDLSSR